MMDKIRWFAFAGFLSVVFMPSAQVVAQQDTKTPERPARSDEQAPPPVTFKPEGRVVVPPSDARVPGQAHTNYKIFVPKGQKELSSATPQNTSEETPASLACLYRVGPSFSGCNPANGGTNHATGGWGAIALVDPYDDPNLPSDLAFFDSYFGLPAANLTVVYANSSWGAVGGLSLTASCSGTPPAAGTTGWDLEESLGVEYAHALAPSAHLILVEACSPAINDLLVAEYVAGYEVSTYGGGDISNSWSVGESSSEAQWDNYFYRYYPFNTTYFASAGDTGSEVGYPSASPWVVSVGGTTINRNSSGNFVYESCWSDSGGGFSTVETWQSPPSILTGMGPWTAYQVPLYGQAAFRSTPDLSFDADPNSGVPVYNTYSYSGFVQVGGTSLSSPAVAAIINASNNRLGQGDNYYSTEALNAMYSELFMYAGTGGNYGGSFYDVTYGSNGHSAVPGYDQCTGIGSIRSHNWH